MNTLNEVFLKFRIGLQLDALPLSSVIKKTQPCLCFDVLIETQYEQKRYQ